MANYHKRAKLTKLTEFTEQAILEAQTKWKTRMSGTGKDDYELLLDAETKEDS